MKRNLAYIFVKTGGVVAFVFWLILFLHFIFTGEVFPVGLQGEPMKGLGAIFFLAYILIDIIFIFKGLKLMMKEETFRSGVKMALVASVLGFNLISMIGSFIGVTRKN